MNPGEQTESALLSAWIKNRDRDAMGQLVRRHIQFVYSVARRQVGGDVHMAEDVTQAVFILLLQKAHRIQNEAVMASWLFTTTRFAASNAVRIVQRRKHYERTTASRAATDYESPPTAMEACELQPLLNDAIGHLSKSDQLCVVMNFLQSKSRAQVAAALGTTESAVQKRLSRAVERMRGYLAARGITTPAAVLGSAMAAAPPISPALIQSTINIAILSHSAQAGAAPGAAAIAKSVRQSTFAIQVKFAAVMIIALGVGGLATAQAVRMLTTRSTQPGISPASTTMPQSAPAINTTNPADNTPSAPPGTVILSDGITLRIAGIAPGDAAADQWFGVDGQPIDEPFHFDARSKVDRPGKYQIMIAATEPAKADVNIRIPGTRIYMTWGPVKGNAMLDFVVFLDPPAGQDTGELRAYIADGLWHAASSPIAADNSISDIHIGQFTASFSALTQQDRQATFWATSTGPDINWRITCTDRQGKVHAVSSGIPNGYYSFANLKMTFDLPAKQIASIVLETRPDDTVVQFKNITLDTGDPATPEIVIGPADSIPHLPEDISKRP
jgi:RNA polymerase sigma factor (sigma-70 family)